MERGHLRYDPDPRLVGHHPPTLNLHLAFRQVVVDVQQDLLAARQHVAVEVRLEPRRNLGRLLGRVADEPLNVDIQTLDLRETRDIFRIHKDTLPTHLVALDDVHGDGPVADTMVWEAPIHEITSFYKLTTKIFRVQIDETGRRLVVRWHVHNDTIHFG